MLLHLACVHTGELVVLSCLAHSDSFMWPSSKSSHVFTCRPAGGCHSRVVASIHLITVDAGLLLGCCRAVILKAAVILNVSCVSTHVTKPKKARCFASQAVRPHRVVTAWTAARIAIPVQLMPPTLCPLPTPTAKGFVPGYILLEPSCLPIRRWLRWLTFGWPKLILCYWSFSPSVGQKLVGQVFLVGGHLAYSRLVPVQVGWHHGAGRHKVLVTHWCVSHQVHSGGKPFSGLVLASFLASFGTRDLRPTWGLGSNAVIIDWLAEAEPAGEWIWCFLKKSAIWPQKLVAEILSWDVNQNPIDLWPKHALIMRSHCVLN